MMLGAVVAGGAGSALIVNQVTKAIFKDDPVKSKKWAPAIKIGLGVACMLYSDNDYVTAAGIGMVAVGGVEALQAFKPDLFNPIHADGPTPPTSGYGKTLDVNAWAVGSYDYGHDGAVAGRYGYDNEVAGSL
jgi:hypothetical protein